MIDANKTSAERDALPTRAQGRILSALAAGDTLRTNGQTTRLHRGGPVSRSILRTIPDRRWATAPARDAPLFGLPEIPGAITERGRAALRRLLG
jgi:hypothetical protein